MKETGRERLRRMLHLSGQEAAHQAVTIEVEDLLEVERTRPCPHCGAQVSRGATVCLYCERELTPVMNAGEFAVRFGSLRPPDQPEEPRGPPHE